MQATLTYARRLEDLLKANNSTDAAAAEGVAFFRTIAPLVARVSWAPAVCRRVPRSHGWRVR